MIMNPNDERLLNNKILIENKINEQKIQG